MRPTFSSWLMVLLLGIIVLLFILAMCVVQPRWWRSPVARGLVRAVIGAAMCGLLLWGAGRVLENTAVLRAGVALTYVTILVTLPAALVMPISAAVDRFAPALLGLVSRQVGRVRRARALPAPPPEARTEGRALSRRSVIRLGSASLPAAFALGGASGFVDGQRDAQVRVVKLRYPNLPRDLEGLRILQLSDVHLGACLGLDALKRGLESVCRSHRPDLIVVTGDLADDPALIPEALRLVAAANARLGALASLGNHEYLHDIEVTRPLYEESPVPLLVGTGRTIRVGAATLYVGGADDPVHMKGDIARLLRPTIAAAAEAGPHDADFRLLLCHRPEGFGPATEAGFDLTLAGHTHGGQIGLFGRSLLERIRPGIGWWGSYAQRRPAEVAEARAAGRKVGGTSRLYTTSGFGHWFPFRVGCPTEMPLLVLEREPVGSDASSRAPA